VVLRELSVVEQRYQAVLAVLEDGLSVTDAAAKVGVSRQTLHAWLNRYAEGGLEQLADRSHRPWSCPHRMDPVVEVRLVELRQLHPSWGPDRLLYRLRREGVAPLPSRAAVGRALARLGLVEPDRRRRAKRRYRRWERGRPMELWQFDVMGGVLLAGGREVKAVTGIDDHSRFCVAVGLVERASSRPVCSVFAQALAAHGVPTQVLTDNGKVFTGRYASRPVEVLFDKICRENGIEHLLTAPRSPTTTGKIERFHGTLRRECLAGREFATLAAAQSVINAWVDEYNTDRPHQSIGRCTPAERFAVGQTLDPGPPLDLTALSTRRDGDDWVSRRVASNGIVCVAWQQVSVGKYHRGEFVDVHVTDRLLEFWSGNDLLRTVVRESKGDIRKKRASLPAQSKRPRQASTEQDLSCIN
jgi:transposase InsO family protein